MRFPDLRSFLRELESRGDLARVRVEVDPNQEITIIQHRVLAAGGPALLFERVKGSPYRLVSNLFGTPARVELALGREPTAIGAELAGAAEQLLPPSAGAIWRTRRLLWRGLRARLRQVRSGPVLDTRSAPPNLERLPCLTCWPKDGGPFFTLPLVHTVDPTSSRRNLGIYRLQRFDAASTGMHWQIEKGGGFHFQRACELGQPLPVSVVLGGPPALTLAAIAPLPEDIDEHLLAAYLMGGPLEVLRRPDSGHLLPARAEFLLEGTVEAGDERREGPFGDHLGHYSHSANFPVYRVRRLLARHDAIYPATVVGIPPQEDYYIGEALQQMSVPLLKLMRPGLVDLWAYPETGFHPMAVAAVRQRYRHEDLKHAMGLLGTGQLSLTKVLIVVDHDVDVRDFRAVSRAVRENVDPETDLHLLSPTAQDTLDFTGPSMNTGSRLILLATRRRTGEAGSSRTAPPSPPTASVHPGIRQVRALGEGFLMAQVADEADGDAVREALAEHPVTGQYLFHVLVSADVPVADDRLALWGWFTRFDPLQDLHPRHRRTQGNRLIMEPPFAVDARWKPGYRDPVAFDPELADRVDRRWDEYDISL